MRASFARTRVRNRAVEHLEPRTLMSGSYVIDGVQSAALDQPRIHALFRRTATGAPIAAVDPSTGDSSFDVQGFLDTGTSSVLLSQETAQGLGIKSETYGGQTVTYEDVGVAGVDSFDVSEPLYASLANFSPAVDGTNPADFKQNFGALRTQIARSPADPLLGEPLDIFGMPVLQGKVAVLDPSPINNIAYMNAYLYNPGTPYHAATATTDPGIPATNLHVKLSYGSFAQFTTVTPAGAAGPTLNNNPFIGPDPVKLLGGVNDGTPAVSMSEGAFSGTGSFLLDTGAQTSFISTAMAGRIHVHYKAGTQGTDNPVLVNDAGVAIPNQYTVPIGGIGGTTTAAGFFADSLTLPTTEGTPIRFTHAPVLVLDVTVENPTTHKTLTLDGDFGMNFLVTSADASGAGQAHAGDFNWVTIDQPNGVLGLAYPGAPTASPGNIWGTVFDDANADGTRQSTEAGIANVRVFVDSNGDGAWQSTEQSALTNTYGTYSFQNLPAGAYKVGEVVPAGYKQTTPAGDLSATVVAGQTTNTGNFGNVVARVSIVGNVFNDANASGTRDAGDANLANWRVYLDANNNGVLDAGEASALTDASGNYTFGNLPAGTFHVREVLQTSWRQTTATPVNFTVAAGAKGTANFGNTQKGRITGSVFIDKNLDRKPEAGEGLANVRVYIDRDASKTFTAGDWYVFTDANGNWAFDNLPAGTYSVRVVPIVGHTLSSPTTGAYAITLTLGAAATGKLFIEK